MLCVFVVVASFCCLVSFHVTVVFFCGEVKSLKRYEVISITKQTTDLYSI